MPGLGNPVIERLTIKNYRVLKDVTFDKLTPLTVLFGPNGSGKSTVFDVFAFLHESFTTTLRQAWDSRNRLAEIRSRDATGPVVFEIKYREGRRPGEPRPRLITYRLEISEESSRPVVVRELLQWNIAPGPGRPKTILDFAQGRGTVYDEEAGRQESESLDSADLLAVSALGQLTRHPNVVALRRFISGWYLSYISAGSMRGTPESGPHERLSRTGDNLPNVMQYLQEEHPDHLARIFSSLQRRIPRLEKLVSEPMPDGRLLLRLHDAPFSEPILAKFASDGTLKLLAYMTVLDDPMPPTIVGIEEPENQLHPRLLSTLAEEARRASERSQVLVTTHSPYFADALLPRELWAIYRAEDGYARVRRAADITPVPSMVEAGAALGDLWMEGFFGEADPLGAAGIR